MAATDKPLRDQNRLDIVFAVSSVAMLVSAVLMFAQDYFREWKPEQRAFRAVESVLAQRMAMAQIPSEEEFDAAEQALAQARKDRDAKQPEVNDIKKKLAELEPEREKANTALAAANADVGSLLSFVYIADEKTNSAGSPTDPKHVDHLKEQYKQAVEKQNEAQKRVDLVMAQMKPLQAKVDAIDADLTKKLGALKKLNDKFDSMVNMSIKKEWGWADTIRAWPIIDGFASPTKIQQITNNNFGINYNFKDVTRFDRCTTCHLGIDRPAYTKENLARLTSIDGSQKEALERAQARLVARQKAMAGLPEAKQVPDPDKLKLTSLPRTQLTEARINEYAAHPRLDLFVGADSKHPIEKFGCTTCHNGQGSSTSFHWASHSPNTSATEEKWTKDLGWSHIHSGDWEFPMYPSRFTEAACLKCHHQVTDLISADNKNEAPKLLRGYNLIRENGCFGCHEIAGRKGGRDVGPDMRLESTPPLVDLPASERARIESDLDNRPGNLRKVGPSLYRIAEKTNEEWTRKWLRAPREFRPDTKMPHFYGTSNNDPSVLPDDQKKLPDAEIHAVAHFLFGASNGYLKDVEKQQKADAADAEQKDLNTVLELLAIGKVIPKTPEEEKQVAKQKEELEAAQRRIRIRKAKTLEDLTGGYAGDAAKGRSKFIERGCLSCHMHQATEKEDGKSPAVISEAKFGPNLSQVTAKLGAMKGDPKSAKVWLVQWLLDPMVYNPRTRMPITHLTPEDATDIATWLLAQPGTDFGPNWAKLDVPAPAKDDLVNLAKVYFVRLLSKSQMDEFFKTQELAPELTADLPAEEREFANTYKAQGEAALKHYVGKRAVGRLGCYACHDIPGFDTARPIGVGLNDWGKKDANKLAFEDIANYFKKHYYTVENWTGEKGKVAGPKEVDGMMKLPYEKFFAHALLADHGNREGYLFQKLGDPRSFDYNRVRAWDERARMPQFRFSRISKKEGESDKDFESRALKEEAEAREAVATFVLGLVGEPVPMPMVNQPKGDRLAEVKGRQTLDAFNCAGCHLLRGGTFELKPSNKVYDDLAGAAKAKRPGDHNFPNHYFWTGHLPASPDSITVNGVLRLPLPPPGDEDEDPKVALRLTQALRVNVNVKVKPNEDERVWIQADLPSSTPLGISPSEFVFGPPTIPAKSEVDTAEKLSRYLAEHGQYGGAFSNLLVGYLSNKDEKAFPRDTGTGDSSKARPLVPPSLIGQGERTQPEWLYEFLLNPFPVRKMTILRMPKFNLSHDDARSLVDYFAGVERSNNPGIGLTYPYEQIAQQDAASTAYFKAKTAEYVARLKSAKAAGGKDKSMFDQRIEELTPIWKSTLKEYESQKDAAKAKLETANKAFKEAESKEKEAKKALDGKKDDKDAEAGYKSAKLALESAIGAKEAWQRELDYLAKKTEASSVESQKLQWQEKDAYLTDGFKLVANKDLCMKCHQIGPFEVKNDVQGPPLTLAHSRLRPGWTERWIAHPDRFLPYPSSMPVNFPKDQPAMFNDIFVGTPIERVQATRDVLMVLPQASQIPANKYWILPAPGDSK